MRLGLPRTRARLTTGVLMASCVAAAAVLGGQHATPAQAAADMNPAADRIPAEHATQLGTPLAGLTPAVAKSAPVKAVSTRLDGLLPGQRPAVAKSASAKPVSTPFDGLVPALKPAVAQPTPAQPTPAKSDAAKPAPAKPKPAKPAAPAPKTYANNLNGWIAEARDILAAHGDKVPSAAAIYARAMTESSGNPYAQNHWDANQALYGGTYGLIQTIKPTFAEWSLPGHKDIFNPVDNIIAGVRYANDRYGSFESVAYGTQGY